MAHPCRRSRPARRAALAALLLGATAAAAEPSALPDAPQAAGGALELEVRSEYSHIRVRREGSVRTMTFVEDDGQEIRQTAIDLAAPHTPSMPYMYAMFASYLFRPQPRRVLIVGLGGGAMTHFLRHHEPKLRIDALEIDPAVVRIAAELFDTRPSDELRIFTEDAFAYIGRTDARYDVIYMDAFLKPAPDTDGAGVPLRMKTIRFLETVRARLEDSGLLVVNLNMTDQLVQDIRSIRSVFTWDRLIRVPGWSNLVVIASAVEEPLPPAELDRRAEALDRRFGTGDSFRQVAAQMVP